MKVLIACEFSGRVREAFNQRGHSATSADILPTEIPGDHYQGDVRDILDLGWDLIIAHPPCTYLCNSGVRWLYNPDKTPNKERWEKMQEAGAFFSLFKHSSTQKIAIENPIPHRFASEIIGEYDQRVHPWMFGDPFVKSTCFWLKGLPPLLPTHAEYSWFAKSAPIERIQECHLEPPGPERSKNRSRTYQGIAEAMAEQWGRV
jgi:hypothetical protein